MKIRLLLILSLFICLNSFCVNPGYFGKHFLVNFDHRFSHAYLLFIPGPSLPYYEPRAKIELVADSKLSIVTHYGFQYNYNYSEELKISGENTNNLKNNYAHNILFGVKYFGNNIAPIGKYHQFGMMVSMQQSENINPAAPLTQFNSNTCISFNYVYGRTFRLNNTLLMDWGVEVNINENLFDNSKSNIMQAGLANPLYQLFSFHIGLTGAFF